MSEYIEGKWEKIKNSLIEKRITNRQSFIMSQTLKYRP